MTQNELMRELAQLLGGDAQWYYDGRGSVEAGRGCDYIETRLMRIEIDENVRADDDRYIQTGTKERGLVRIVTGSERITLPKTVNNREVLRYVDSELARSRIKWEQYQEALDLTVTQARNLIKRDVEWVETSYNFRPAMFVMIPGTQVTALRIVVGANGQTFLLRPDETTAQYNYRSKNWMRHWLIRPDDNPQEFEDRPLPCMERDGFVYMRVNRMLSKFLTTAGSSNVVEVNVQSVTNAPVTGQHSEFYQSYFRPKRVTFIEHIK